MIFSKVYFVIISFNKFFCTDNITQVDEIFKNSPGLLILTMYG